MANRSLFLSIKQSLSSCSITYLRHILSELQKQVQDLEQDEKNHNQRLMIENADEDYFNSRINPFNPFDQEDNIVGLNGDRGSMTKLTNHNKNQTNCFSRKPFIEIHTHYGLQFQKFFNQRSQSKTEIVNDLILL